MIGRLRSGVAFLAAYFNPELSEEDRMAWLKILILSDLEFALGWRISQLEWHAGSSPRVRWLCREAGEVLGADDPFAAAKQWLDSPPTPPRRLAA